MQAIISRAVSGRHLTIGIDTRGRYRVLLDGEPPAGLTIAGIVDLTKPEKVEYARKINERLIAAGYTHSVATRIGLHADEAMRLQAAHDSHPAVMIHNYEAVCAAIPGLRELDDAHKVFAAWHSAFNRAMDDEMLSTNPPAAPQIATQALSAQYPRAVAFRRARAESRKHTPEYAAAGERAMQRLLTGEPVETVMAEMIDAAYPWR